MYPSMHLYLRPTEENILCWRGYKRELFHTHNIRKEYMIKLTLLIVYVLSACVVSEKQPNTKNFNSEDIDHPFNTLETQISARKAIDRNLRYPTPIVCTSDHFIHQTAFGILLPVITLMKVNFKVTAMGYLRFLHSFDLHSLPFISFYILQHQ